MPYRSDREYRNMESIAAQENEEGKVVTGYACTFSQPYELFRDGRYIVREQVDPHAFDGTDVDDVIMQYDHMGRVFARTRNKTLEISCDDHGLKIRAELGGTEIGRQLYDEIRGGYTDRMSFGFTVDEEKREETEDKETGNVTILRTITRIRKLYDVSAVSLPANDATEISARSLGEGVIAEAMKELRDAPDPNEEVEPVDENEATEVTQIPDEEEEREDQEQADEPEAEEEEREETDEEQAGDEAEAPAEEDDEPEDREEEAEDEDEPEPEETRAAGSREAPENGMTAEEIRTNMEAMEARAAVAEGRGRVIEEHSYKEEKPMTELEIRKSTEYVDAFAKYLRSGDDRECRALLKTENASGKVPVPVMVDEIIRHAWDNEELLSKCRKTNFRGNLKVAFEKAGDNAWVHTEGTSAPTEEALELGIVTMTPANIKKWIHITDEDVTMGGEAFVRYIYEELAYQIMKKLAALVVGDITALDTTNGATAPGAARITEAPGLTTIANAFANLSDEATNPVIIMNKLTWANFQAAYAAGNFAVDPFAGLPVITSGKLPAFSTASANDTYAIVGDLSAVQANFPAGEGMKLIKDEYSLAEKDLVKLVGRIFCGHDVVAPGRLVRLTKEAGAATT